MSTMHIILNYPEKEETLNEEKKKQNRNRLSLPVLAKCLIPHVFDRHSVCARAAIVNDSTSLIIYDIDVNEHCARAARACVRDARVCACASYLTEIAQWLNSPI